MPDTEVAIADAVGRQLDERHVGEILVKSDSLMRGYRGEVESAVRDGWLWTGDLGYLADGDLYVTGRAKELIIVGGAELLPRRPRASGRGGRGRPTWSRGGVLRA